MTKEQLEVVAKQMLDAAYRVHTQFGPGLLENAYTACLVFELREIGLDIKTEIPVPLVYKGTKLTDIGYRIDILIENEIVIEVKSLESIAPVHLSQLITYLKLFDRKLGFLLNFNVERFRDGIYRRVNKL